MAHPLSRVDDSSAGSVLNSFRRWVRTLSWNEMQSAMAFHVRNSNTDTRSTGIQRNHLGPSPHLVSTSRDELDILQDMVQLQWPLPTPIHPRAIPYLPASEQGRGYVETDHFSPNPLSKPLRWLRLIGHLDSNSTSEAQLLSALQHNGQRSHRNTKGKPTLNTQRRKKDIYKGDNHKRSFSTMDVVGRQFRNEDGTVLTAEGTTLVQEADRLMLFGTRIRMDHDDPAGVVVCRFDYSHKGTPRGSQEMTTPNFIRLLKCTSRGNFATQIVDTSRVDNPAASLYPPWFDPTDRWFPLAMYLSARFEMALWNAFYRRSNSHSVEGAVPLDRAPWYDDNVEGKTLGTLLIMSVVESVKDILHQERHKLHSPSGCSVRDCLLWDDLVNGSVSKCSTRALDCFKVSDLSVCPLLELGAKSDALRQQIRKRFQRLRTDHSMEMLLQEDVEGVVSDETKAASNTSKKLTPSLKRLMVKKKKKAVSYKVARDSNLNADAITDSMDQSEFHSSSSSDSLEFEQEARNQMNGQRRERSSGHKQDKNVWTRARSRNTLLVLSVIDDVMSIVFRQVGLDSVDGEDIDGSNYGSETQLHSSYLEHISVDNQNVASGESVQESTKPLNAFSEPLDTKFFHEKSSTPTFSKKDKMPQQESNTTSEEEWYYDDDRIFTPLIHHVDDESMVHPFPFHPNTNFFLGDPTATIRTSNLQGFSSIESASLSPQFFHHNERLDDTAWDVSGYPAADSWDRFRGFDRNESMFIDFFHTQSNDEAVLASSTAASIASSDKGYDGDSAPEVNELDYVDDTFLNEETEPEDSNAFSDHAHMRQHAIVTTELPDPVCVAPETDFDEDKSRSGSEFHSPSPPSTPSPTLSPILVSLSELSQLPRESLELLQIPSSLSSDTMVSHTHSLNGEPLGIDLNTSSSPDNLRVYSSAEEYERKIGSQTSIQPKLPVAPVKPVKCRDDHDIIDKATVRRSADTLTAYRNVVMSRSDASRSDQIPPDREVQKNLSHKKPAAKPALSKVESPRRFQFDFVSSHERSDGRRYTRSDFDGNDDYQALHEATATRIDDADNNTVTKDGTTTISSGASQRESDGIAMLREQRNAYRDMSLTLGAEVATLKNILAAQRSVSFHPFLGIQSGDNYQPFRNADVFDPATIPRFFQNAPRARTLAALSDAGYRGEQESLASEDEVGTRMLTGENVLHTASDVPCGYNSGFPIELMQLRFQTSKHKNDVLSPTAMQSRLTRDIFQFLERNSSQLRQLNSKVQAAVERMNRLVKTLWPRAQVKLYGSHVTGLSVVTSDLDFVVCLPAVHKNAVAVAPGALEGRNAINETSQKLLARRLKGESWIDPRSLKLIDRTAVPVIKVSTKDTKKYTLHLDISFDSPGHHGLEAAQMISSIMNELPLLRPLVVVLKQFLIERSLLEAYTGGISSYGLSLMVARYLQEQSPGADVGSLLMGFLDFYGNHFDPRSTGISVRKRQYFARPNYYTSRNQGEAPMWGPIIGYQPPQLRRSSFSDKESTNIKSGRPRLQHQGHGNQHQSISPLVPFQPAIPDERNSFDNGMPYTFDPLFIEDPLSAGNNVGRNAFRIFQVQRAFSDAHCALLAALEWDEEGSDLQAAATPDVGPSNTLDSMFPLLKCLLRSSDDVVYDL